MSPLPDAVEEAIAQLLAAPAADFLAGVARLGASYPELAAQIEATAHRARAMASSAFFPAESGAARCETFDLVRGDRMGPFTVLECIGEGGMGVVYLAEQYEPMQRRVALKVIKLGMDTRAVLARFQIERQALAMMDHPCIAKVLQAGATPGGRPYFAMEYVPGMPITRYCDEQRSSLDERLRLFVSVCRGVQHAHNKGVIHRDLTPCNVLVVLQDGVPTPKIIDFGLARATDRALAGRTLFTERGLVLGTPEYMSPEQTGIDAIDVDMRSDVYSLGVLLYELLTGLLPFPSEDLRLTSYDAMCRRIREQDPLRPSTRLMTSAYGSEPAAHLRSSDVRALLRALQGDLDWIVLKCLEKDRARRYETVSHLADDVERHLEGQPVLARAPSMGYRIAKLMRRHRGRLAAAAGVLVGLLLSLAVAIVFWLDARANAESAEQHRQQAERQQRFAELRSYVAAMRAAASSIEHSDPGEARSALALCPEALRRFEWQHLHLATELAVRRSRVGPAPVTALAASDDGSLLAVTCGDHVVRIVAAATGDIVAELDVAGAPVGSLAFVRDGTLVIGTENGHVTSATGDGRQVRRIAELDAGAVGIFADGDRLRVVTRTGAILLCDGLVSGPRLQFSDHAFAAAHDTASGRLAMAGRGKRILLMDAAADGGLQARRWLEGHRDSVVSLAFTVDGTRLLSGSMDRVVLVWDAAEGQLLHRLVGHTLDVTALAVSPDGELWASGSADNTVRLWSSGTGALLAVLLGHSDRIVGTCFLPNPRRLVSLDAAGNLLWWDPAVLAPNVELTGHEDWVRALAASPDGRQYVTGTYNPSVDVGQVLLWDADSGSRERMLYAGQNGVYAVLHGGTWIAAGMRDGTVAFFASSPGAEPEFVPLSRHTVTELVRGPDGLQLAAAHGEEITFVDTMQRLPVGHMRGAGVVGALAATPDGKQLAWGCGDKAFVRDWVGGALRELTVEVGVVLALALDPTGRRLAAAGSLGKGRIVDLGTGSSLLLTGHSKAIDSIAFDPAGERVLTAGRDCLIRIWHAECGECLLVLRGHRHAVGAAIYSPDGMRVVSAGDDWTVRIWEGRAGPLQRLWAGRRR